MTRAAAVLVALGAAAPALAQNLVVTTAPGSPPIANAVTMGQPSSISFNVSNTRAGTRLRQIEFRLPSGYASTGGAGPAGWSVTRVSTTAAVTVRFRISDCALDGIAAGGSGTFRLDVTPPTVSTAADLTDSLSRINPSDPCGGTTGWTVSPASSVTWARKTLLVTGSVTPAGGTPPLTATATYTVRNLTSGTRSGITLSQASTPATTGSCLPASLTLAAGASSSFTCNYSLTALGAYTFAGAASNGSASSVGTTLGPVTVSSASATFAFDDLKAGPGEQVRATLTVQNNGVSSITVTPPGYAALTIQNLAKSNGTNDPKAATVGAGQSASFVYTFDVTGVVGSQYVVSGTASTTVGPTNLATTPPGTVSAALVTWSPPGIVPARSTPPYLFTVTVRNESSANIGEVQIVNPQNATWTGLGSAGTSSPLTYWRSVTNGSTTYLRYTGTLAPNATATIQFSFTAIPAATQPTTYPFQVVVIPSGGGSFSTTYSQTTTVVTPISDVSGLSILSSAGGQVLSWTNTSGTGNPHDGVVVFRRAAPGVPTIPADAVDYTDPANQTGDYWYADEGASAVNTLADAATGAYNYRVCNRDAYLVYSSCNSGFWSNQGWLDSAVAPTGGWTHQLGAAITLVPGIVPGSRVGFATNAPALAVLDTATGNRSFDPVSLSGVPTNGTPILPLGDGRNVLFAAGGSAVAAVDVATGTPLWQVTKAGESFTAGVSAILRRFAAPAFQAAYAMDVLLLPSTSGRLLAVNASTGATLWTLDVGVPLRAGTWHDSATNRLFVASDGGVRAYDLATSSSSTPPGLAGGFSGPAGTFRLACVRAPATTDFACVENSTGVLYLLDKVTGAVKSSVDTGASSPTTLVRTTSVSGFVVSNASRVVRVLASGTPAVLNLAGTWNPGLTLSPVNVLNASGFIIVAASDKKLHKLALATAADTGTSVTITPQPAGALLGAPVLDVTSDYFLFGTSDGRLWAVPVF